MDPRVFNASVLVGLLAVAVGLTAWLSWPIAAVGTGLLVVRCTFAAARLAARGE